MNSNNKIKHLKVSTIKKNYRAVLEIFQMEYK